MPKKLPERNGTPPDEYERGVERWLERGGSVDARYHGQTNVASYGDDHCGITLLHHASSRGLVGVAELLINRGAKLDLASGSNKFTALMSAVFPLTTVRYSTSVSPVENCQ